MEKYRKQCAEKGLPTDDETVVLFAMFPQQVEGLFKKPSAAPTTATAATTATATTAVAPPAPAIAASAPAPAPIPARASNGALQKLFVTVNGKRHAVTVETIEG